MPFSAHTRVTVSASSFLQCFDTAGGYEERHPTYTNLCLLSPEIVFGTSGRKGGLANPHSTGKLALKWWSQLSYSSSHLPLAGGHGFTAGDWSMSNADILMPTNCETEQIQS